jgi:hypothetical protein
MIRSTHNQSNALNALEALRGVLREIGWESYPVDPEGVIAIDLRSPDSPVSDALAAIALKSERFIFYLNLARHCPVERQDQLVQLINLINWQLSIGNFEMDPKDGHVRFRSSIDFADAVLEPQLIRNHILAAMRATETYVESLLNVMEGRSDAADAFIKALATPKNS